MEAQHSIPQTDQPKTKGKGKVDDIDKLVSNRLKTRRLLLGLSQQDLSEAVNVSIQQVQKYEKATNRISSGKLYAFADFLKVPINYFFEKDNLYFSPSHSSISNLLQETSNEYSAKPDVNKVNKIDKIEKLDKINNLPSTYNEKEVINLVKSFNLISNPDVRKKIIDLVKSLASE